MLGRFFGAAKRSFDSLSEQEVLALAISSEEEDARIYRAYAEGLRHSMVATVMIFIIAAAFYFLAARAPMRRASRGISRLEQFAV